MKVFVTSDIHGRFNLLNKIVEFIKNREDIDCIILCGDITGDYQFRFFYELEYNQYQDYKKIISMLQKLNKKILFIQGNHDVFTIDKTDSSYIPYCSEEEYKNFVAIEYVNFSMYGLKREGNEEDMIHRMSKIAVNEKSIIVSHIPLFKCLDKSNSSVYRGSKAIRDMVIQKKPAYYFCGHVHEEFGFKKLHNTYVFNAACDKNIARGWVVDLETAKYEKIVL